MKPRTTMRIDGQYTAPIGDDDDMFRDATCAHALMQAMKEIGGHATKFIQIRADTILREWGFDSGEVE